MIQLTYDIPKNKITIKSDNKKAEKDLKEIIITISLCATLITGFALYLDFKKDIAVKQGGDAMI